MDKLKMHSPNLTEGNIAKLAELFPSCVTEARDEHGKVKQAIDFDQLRQELSDHIVEGPQERYHLNWPGKREALLAANAPIAKTLRPCREESVDFNTTKNLFIEGDNLHVLKLIQETYLEKAKVIYIDPPYNTGKDFIYKDNFSSSKEVYEEESRQKDEEGGRLVANPDTRGRYHSDWMSMIYSRLIIARRLLKSDGIIMVSIDDYEQAALKKLLDQIFGEENFVAQLVWEKGRKNDAKFFSTGHEYIIIYAKNLTELRDKNETWREEKPGARNIWKEYLRLKEIYDNDFKSIETGLSKWYSDLPKGHPSKKWARYKRVDQHGPWRDRDISWPGGDGPRYEVLHPVTGLPCAIPDAGWRYSSFHEMQRQINLGLVEFRADHTEPPFRKAHIRPIAEENKFACEFGGDSSEEGDIEFSNQVRGSYFYKQSQVSVKYLRNLMGAKVFTNPKDHDELAKLINYVTPNEEEALIIDFFAGSASTAEAVFKANATYGKNHKFVMVQLPEDLEIAEKSATGTAKKTVQSAIKMMKEKGRALVLSEVAKERVRKAGEVALSEDFESDWNQDIGFRVLKVDNSNMEEVYYQPGELRQDMLSNTADNIRQDRTPEDLLFQVLLDWGVDLSLPLAQKDIAGKTVYFVDGSDKHMALAACFDLEIDEAFVKQLAEYEPLRAVFRDAGFANDSVKINVEQIFAQKSPNSEVKVI